MVDNGMSAEQREIAELKARLSALESNNSSKKQFNFNKDKVKGFFSKNKKLIIILSILTVFVVAIMTTCISFLGIRGVYVNENDPYESYSFTATAYEKRDKSYEGDMYVDKGTWSRSGNKLTISYKDEWFGKVKEEYNVIVGNKNNSLTIISGEDEDTFKRVSKVSWNLSKNKKIDVTFDLNGGIASEEIRNIEVKFGESFEYKLPTPTRDDATFKGWYTTVDGFKNNGKVYVDGKPVYEDVTYYANWFLHSDCPEHEYNSRCVCTICGKTADVYDKEVHSFNESCICTKCELDTHSTIECGICSLCQQQMHNVDINCKCIICGAEAHQYDEWYQCEKCSYINTDEVANNLGLYLSIEGDEITITGSRGDVTNVIIPNYVTLIGSSAFRDCSSLTSVVIGDSVTSIGDYAFYDCGSLTSVTIGDSVTSIGNYTFYNCSSLTSVVIPDSVTSIGSSAFYNCSSLTSVVIPDSVTSIGDYAFYDCGSLTSATIGNSVTSIGSSAFYNCSSLTSVVIPDSVTSIGSDVFYGCSSLASVVIGDSVTSIESDAFYNCSSLTSVVIPDSVTSIGSSVFYNCPIVYASIPTIAISCISKSKLKEVVITGGTSIRDYDFYGCDSLTSVVIGDSVTSIRWGAFYGCDSLTSVVIGDSVTSIGYEAFIYCYRLVEVYNLSSLNITAGSYSNDYLGYYALDVYTSLDTLSKLSIDSNGYIIYTDGEEKILVGYQGAETKLTLPNCITSINKYAFRDCSSLTSVVIPNSVSSIGESAFEYCYKLVEVYNLSALTITAGSSYNGYVGYYAKNVYTPTYGESKLSTDSNGYVIYTDGTDKILVSYTGSETELVLPDGITEINNYAFEGCSSLTSVTIGDSVTSIGNGAFLGCSSLTSVVIGDSVTSIGKSAFFYCDSLTSVTIGDSVTTIGSNAFYGCSSLESITFRDPSTWYRTSSSFAWEDKTGGTQTDVSTPTNNDEIFVDNYYNYWYKL